MKPVISAICPVKNEEENISLIYKTFKPLGNITEVVFVEGGSSDMSWDVASKLNGKTNKYGVHFRSVKQLGKGKSGAVTTGFDIAEGKYLIIVDADLTVPHQDLMRILELFTLYGDHIIASGNRLRGLPKPKAFYWINYVGNYFFRYYYSFVIGDKILDVACGTKAMSKQTWLRVKKLRQRGGELDSWGDIDWLYYGHVSGAEIYFAKIDYKERKYGISKLQSKTIRLWFAGDMFIIGLKIMMKKIMRKDNLSTK